MAQGDHSSATQLITIDVLDINESTEIVHNGLSYYTIVSTTTGRVWLDRNLGATAACDSTTHKECFGDYYQWGRESDGHEKYNSATSSTLANGISGIGSSFILSDRDWTTTDVEK